MKASLYVALFATVVSYSGITSAAATNFIDHGYYTTDTTDASNVIDWLDVTPTFNMSYSQVNPLLTAASATVSGDLKINGTNYGSGWHYATDQQFLDMINHYTGESNTDKAFVSQSASTIAELTSLFGSGPTGGGQCNVACTYGLVVNDPNSSELWAAGISYKVFPYINIPAGTGTNPHSYQYAPTLNNATLGSFLVRNSVSAVPLPTTALLLAPALFGLIGFRRKLQA